MKSFMDEDFLLNSNAAVKLYQDFAKDMPIFDYHCHLNPKEIAENKKYENITELWLGGDHYKWRAMRTNGIYERYITGGADDKEKFLKWAETMPYCIGNPLFHWAHLELRRYFGIQEVLSPETAEYIWDRCNEMLKSDEFTARNLVMRSNVKAVCTTDDPCDSLEYHAAIAADDSFDVKVLPTFRPDKAIYIENDAFKPWLARLSEISGLEIKRLNEFRDVLLNRLQYFHNAGCRISDHALYPVVFEEVTEDEAEAIFHKAIGGRQLYAEEIKKYRSYIMLFLAKQYARLGWTMQLHLGTVRNNNKVMMQKLGPDTGFDTIGDKPFVEPLAKLLDNMSQSGKLPRTIIYCINPADNEAVAALAGCFQDSDAAGKIQFGSGWWFNDNKEGMIRQMTSLANLGLLGRFVGMLTDSRSFLSYTRHEYFRRILCGMLGEWMENGEAPYDMDLMGEMVRNISFDNAKRYFKIDF